MFLQSFRAVFVFVVYFKLRFFLLCFMNTSGRMYVNFVHVCAQKSMSFLTLCYAMPCHAMHLVSSAIFNDCNEIAFDASLATKYYYFIIIWLICCTVHLGCCCCSCCLFFIFVFKHIITYIIMIYLVCFNCLAHLSPYLTVASITSAQTLDMSIGHTCCCCDSVVL